MTKKDVYLTGAVKRPFRLCRQNCISDFFGVQSQVKSERYLNPEIGVNLKKILWIIWRLRYGDMEPSLHVK